MNKAAYFGEFGGQFVPETAMSVLKELERAYKNIASSKEFKAELKELLREYVGRPTPLYYAKNLSAHYGFKIYLKREDLCHTGAHKINNALAQALLAKKMGKRRIIAETGAGQHGVATATAAALLGLECKIYMGAVDVKRQRLNVFRMKLLGAQVQAVKDGLATLKEATTAAIQAWINDVESLFYVIGSVVGPHPYPKMVADFQSVIGAETKAQLASLKLKPDYVIACVGGGSNAMGIFGEFIKDSSVKLIGVEAGGLGAETAYHAATITKGKVGVIHGMKTLVLQNRYGMIDEVHSISAGLDYPGIGPQHAHLATSHRAKYVAISDDEAMGALALLAQKEGIIAAIESAHALAYLKKLKAKPDSVVVVNLSGRGDKDMHTIAGYKKGQIYG